VSIKSHFPPQLKPSEGADFTSKLALWCYTTHTPFTRVDNPEFKKAIAALRSDAKVPNRKDLGGQLLDNWHTKVEAATNEYMSSQMVTLTNDAWTNPNGDSIMNFCAASTTDIPLLLESIDCGGDRHTAEYIASHTERIIIRYPNIAGGMFDNTSTNVKVMELLQDKYPDKYFHGCNCHMLHLLVGDLFDARKNDGTYPEGYPFIELNILVDDVTTATIFFKRVHAARAKLKSLQKEQKKRSLKLSGATRWGSIRRMFSEIKNSWGQLTEIVVQHDFVSSGRTPADREKREKLRLFLTTAPNYLLLGEALLILEPIDIALRLAESDAFLVSDVYELWESLKHKFDDLRLDPNKISYIRSRVSLRWQKIYGDAHGVGYLLDPKYVGEKMDRSLRCEVENFIREFPVHGHRINDQPLQDAISRELDRYFVIMRNERQQDRRIKDVCDRKLAPIHFWEIESTYFPLLSKVAKVTFAMVASNASVERSFKTCGNILTKARNRLHNSKVAKLALISSNYKLLDTRAHKRKFEESIAVADNEDGDLIVEASSSESDENSGDEEEDHDVEMI
jgi:hypothetical protein